MVLQALGLVALGAVIPTAAMLAAKLRPRLLGGALRSVAAKASSAAPTWTPTPPPQKVGGSRQWELLQNTCLACPDPRRPASATGEGCAVSDIERHGQGREHQDCRGGCARELKQQVPHLPRAAFSGFTLPLPLLFSSDCCFQWRTPGGAAGDVALPVQQRQVSMPPPGSSRRKMPGSI